MKSAPHEHLLDALRKVAAGGVYASEGVRQLLMDEAAGGEGQTEGLDGLSNQQLHVFRLMGEGYDTTQIAARLGISPRRSTPIASASNKSSICSRASSSCAVPRPFARANPRVGRNHESDPRRLGRGFAGSPPAIPGGDHSREPDPHGLGGGNLSADQHRRAGLQRLVYPSARPGAVGALRHRAGLRLARPGPGLAKGAGLPARKAVGDPGLLCVLPHLHDGVLLQHAVIVSE